MKITKHEAENMMNMLTSVDEDNGYLALKAVETFDYEEGTEGYLIYFFKFSRYSVEEWKKEAPKAYEILNSLILNIDSPLTYSSALTYMINKKACKDSIELYIERHVKDLTQTLERLGYPIDKLNFNISLKE
jgi:hypothetical protein